MNDLGDLKRAMHSPPGFAPRELDLDEIIQAGGRLRRRRRLAAGAAAALSVTVLLVGGSQLFGTENQSAGTPIAPAAAATLSPTPSPTGATAWPDEARPLGAVISTGIAAADGEWVLYAVPVDDPNLPGIRFGIVLAVRQPSGRMVSSIETNEFNGSDRAPGFHSSESAQVIGGRTTLAFGYYVGKPHRISATIGGTAGHRNVTAHLKAWSEDSSVVVFWFSPADVGPKTNPTALAAYDTHGKKLSARKGEFGVG